MRDDRGDLLVARSMTLVATSTVGAGPNGTVTSPSPFVWLRNSRMGRPICISGGTTCEVAAGLVRGPDRAVDADRPDRVGRLGDDRRRELFAPVQLRRHGGEVPTESRIDTPIAPGRSGEPVGSTSPDAAA